MKLLILILSIILCLSSVYAQSTSNKTEKLETVESRKNTKAAERTKEEEIIYTKVIAKADELFTARDFAKAKEMYSRAALLKPSDPYPKTKIEEIDQILATQQQEELDNHYNDIIKSADSCFTEKKYREAKEKYILALALKAAEQYPKNKIAEIENLLNYEAPSLKKQEYTKLIAEADALFKSKNFVTAKEYYSHAVQLKPSDPYPKTKIAEIEAILANQEAEYRNKQIYTKIISEADTLFARNKYNEAKAKYNEILVLDSTAVYPRQQICEIDKIYEFARAEHVKKHIYDSIIKKADYRFAAKHYVSAKECYEEAIVLQGTDQYSKQKLAEIEKILIIEGEKVKWRAEIPRLINEGDSLFALKKYDEAKLKYRDVMGIDSKNEYAYEKTLEINTILANQATEQAFEALIIEGDKYRELKDYEKAKACYNNALTLDPTSIIPIHRIAEIDALLKVKK